MPYKAGQGCSCPRAPLRLLQGAVSAQSAHLAGVSGYPVRGPGAPLLPNPVAFSADSGRLKQKGHFGKGWEWDKGSRQKAPVFRQCMISNLSLPLSEPQFPQLSNEIEWLLTLESIQRRGWSGI